MATGTHRLTPASGPKKANTARVGQRRKSFSLDITRRTRAINAFTLGARAATRWPARIGVRSLRSRVGRRCTAGCEIREEVPLVVGTPAPDLKKAKPGGVRAPVVSQARSQKTHTSQRRMSLSLKFLRDTSPLPFSMRSISAQCAACLPLATRSVPPPTPDAQSRLLGAAKSTKPVGQREWVCA